MVLVFIVMAMIVTTLTYGDSLTAWVKNGEFEDTPIGIYWGHILGDNEFHYTNNGGEDDYAYVNYIPTSSYHSDNYSVAQAIDLYSLDDEEDYKLDVEYQFQWVDEEYDFVLHTYELGLWDIPKTKEELEEQGNPAQIALFNQPFKGENVDNWESFAIQIQIEETPAAGMETGHYEVDAVEMNIYPVGFSRSSDSDISDLKKLVADDISRLAKDEYLVAILGPKGLSVKVYSSKDNVMLEDIEIVY